MVACKVIQEIEKELMKESIPEVSVGDTVVVAKYIVEGKKKRIQNFQGIVVKKEKKLSRASITVRKIVDNVGVEKTFLVHSPTVDNIKVLKRGKVRRAKLYYLRNRIGVKATRVKSKDNY